MTTIPILPWLVRHVLFLVVGLGLLVSGTTILDIESNLSGTGHNILVIIMQSTSSVFSLL